MNYVFHVRDWNIDFYIQLEKELIEKNQDLEILWLTMNFSAYNRLKVLNINVLYLPDFFVKNSLTSNDSLVQELDSFMYDKFTYGVEFLYEMERFKPKSKDKPKFLRGHINTFMELIPENAKMISLTCDHFVYLVSAYINELKGGSNYFIQPIGFPMNAQVMMSNFRDLNSFMKDPLNESALDQYIDSLILDPKVSIHYMKPQKLISLKHSLLKRAKDLNADKTSQNIFTYLEPQTTNIIPGRFLQKSKINYTFEYLTEFNIESIAKESRIFYYPLQFEPEMTILAYSPWFKSQLEVVRLISQSLRIGDLLLLKENPKMIGVRNRAYYDTIASYQNVKWADPDINSRNIIRQSFKVISITGTATIEAASLGVNSILFGHPPFRDLLIQKPIAELPLTEFIEVLYKNYSSEEILQSVRRNWPKFSQSLLFGNYIPSYYENKFTLKDNQLLAKDFTEKVLY